MIGSPALARSAILLASVACGALVACPQKNKPPPVERVWLGERVACAALSTGELRCQGSNGDGQLGPGASAASPHGPAVMPVSGKVLAVHHRASSLCVVTEGHPDACFGALRAKEPVEEPRGCDRDSSGRVACAGPRWPEPPDLSGLPPSVALAEGRAHACALLSTGTVACWGANDHGQLASPPPRGSRRPASIQGIYGAVSITAAGDSTCVVERDKTVRCWGGNEEEHLSVGRGATLDVPTPVHF